MYGRLNILLTFRKRGQLLAALLSILTASLLISGAPAATAATTGTASVSGKVIVPPGTSMILIDMHDATNYSAQYSAAAAADGTYTITGVPAGTYKVDFAAYGAVGQWYANQPSYDAGTPVTIADGQAITGLNATLVQGATISGHITVPTGYDASQVQVNADDPKSFTSWSTVRVGSDGNYSIGSLAAGSYRIAVFGPGLLDNNLPNPVTVTTGQSVTVNATMVGQATISGTIGGPPSTEFAQAYVEVYDAAGDGTRAVTSTRANADGTYTVGSLAAGSYKVRFSATDSYLGQWYANKDSFANAAPISVAAAQNVTGINATLTKGGTISGTVAGPTGPELTGVYAYVYQSSDSTVNYKSSPVQSDGSFSVAGLPSGSYKVFFSDFGYQDANGVRQQAYASQWYANQATFSAAGSLSVTAGQITGGISTTLNPAATITGQITGPTAAEMSGICVAAVPASTVTPLIVKPTTTNAKPMGASPGPCFQALAASPLQVAASTTPAQDGSYRLLGLAPGSYKVVALPVSYWNTGVQQPVPFVEQWFTGKILRSSATDVTGNGGQTTAGTDFALRADMSFGDVPAGTLFHDEITWLGSEGISTGWTETDGSHTYRPLTSVNRDAMAAFLYRLAGSPSFTPPAVSPFTDVATDNPFYKQITWLASTGISTGYPGPNNTKSFQPLSPVNRDAMAAFLYRFAGSPAYTAPASSPFTDVATNNQFYAQINWLADTKITTGWTAPDGTRTFQPVSAVNRDAMAAFMSRYQNMDALKQ